MTERTEGLVTYTEEARVTRAVVKAVHGGEAAVLTAENQLIRVKPYGYALTPDEARALRDAITVMLGEEPVKCAVCLEEDQETGRRIIARLEKYRASHHPIQDDFTDGLVAAYQTAEQLVREEYGL